MTPCAEHAVRRSHVAAVGAAAAAELIVRGGELPPLAAQEAVRRRQPLHPIARAEERVHHRVDRRAIRREDLRGEDRDRLAEEREREVEGIEQPRLLHVGRQASERAPTIVALRQGRVGGPDRGDRSQRVRTDRALVIVDRDADLLEVVDALRAAGGLSRRLHRGEQERDQDRDDGDDHQQFDEGECASSHVFPLAGALPGSRAGGEESGLPWRTRSRHFWQMKMSRPSGLRRASAPSRGMLCPQASQRTSADARGRGGGSGRQPRTPDASARATATCQARQRPVPTA